MVMIRVTVWNENVHEKEIPEVTTLYPQGIHGELAAYLRTLGDIEVRTACRTRLPARLRIVCCWVWA